MALELHSFVCRISMLCLPCYDKNKAGFKKKTIQIFRLKQSEGAINFDLHHMTIINSLLPSMNKKDS